MFSELPLIESIRQSCESTLRGDEVGIGDDCAVLAPFDGRLVVTTDTMVENVHFKTDFSEAYDVGWKALAASLSDIAAMGATPRYALVSLQLTDSYTSRWVISCYQAMVELAKNFSVSIVGGDTVSGKEFAITTTVIGSSGQPITRTGARVDDELWISGSIGGAGAGLSLLSNLSSTLSTESQLVIDRHRRPEPQVALGIDIASTTVATAMIDVSDGLIQDCRHICNSSEVAMVIEQASLPLLIPAELRDFTWMDAVTSGDDYELLFTAPPSAHDVIARLPEINPILPSLTKIGNVVAIDSESSSARVFIKDSSGELLEAEALLRQHGKAIGYQHGGKVGD